MFSILVVSTKNGTQVFEKIFRLPENLFQSLIIEKV